MVRLKGAFSEHTEKKRWFQFQYGAIKGRKTKNFLLNYCSFNSSMVRLKGRATRYQAQYIAFQFQYGAIKGPWQISYRETLCGFNSSMVRLKAGFGVWLGGVLACFNSSMVRLKGYGVWAWANGVVRFNSSMVRLKAACSMSALSAHQKFQFQYGAIKGSILLIPSPIEPSFNSSMVRLKDGIPRFQYLAGGFQFQYGAIKGHMSVQHLCTSAGFQFQYGAIKGLHCAAAFRKKVVSIPVWCD